MRLASFNLHHGAPPGCWLARNGAAVAACRGLDVDILALQEVDVCSPRSWFANQPVRVAGGDGADVWFAPNWAKRGWGRFGNAMVVRGRIIGRRVVELPVIDPTLPRRAMFGRVELSDGFEVHVIVTHLSERGRGDGGVPLAVRQLEVLLDAAADVPPPRVLLGDLNLGVGRAGPVLAAAGFQWREHPPTYPTPWPRTRIDWVAADGLILRVAEVPKLWVSDHRPLVVEAAAGEL